MIASVVAPALRLAGGPAAQFIGAGIIARNAAKILQQGFFTAPIYITDSMILRDNAYLFVTVSPLTAPVYSAANIRWYLATAIARQDGTIIDANFMFDWPEPNPFPIGKAYRFFLDNGLGRTFNPLTFQRDDCVGFQFLRLGNDLGDTYTGTIKIAESLEFQMNQRCCN